MRMVTGVEGTKDNQDYEKHKDLVVPEEKLSGKIRMKDFQDMMSFSIGCCGIFIFVVLSILAAVL